MFFPFKVSTWTTRYKLYIGDCLRRVKDRAKNAVLWSDGSTRQTKREREKKNIQKHSTFDHKEFPMVCYIHTNTPTQKHISVVCTRAISTELEQELNKYNILFALTLNLSKYIWFRYHLFVCVCAPFPLAFAIKSCGLVANQRENWRKYFFFALSHSPSIVCFVI